MIESNCEYCGNKIIRRGNRVGRFCSINCKAKWQLEQKPANRDWLYQKYVVEKMSTYDIAKIVDRNPKRVYEWIVEYNIPTRPRGDNLHGADNSWNCENWVNPFSGKKHSEKTKKILSEKASVEKPYLRGERNGMFGRRGDKNPNYIDGSTPERQMYYSRAEWRKLRRTVYGRDHGKCVRCCVVGRMNIHHVIPWAGNIETRLEITNVVSLCTKCHRWVHSKKNINREYLA